MNMLIQSLKREIKELREGACRYHCRTARENWIEGYRWAGRKRGSKPIATADAEAEYREYTEAS